MGMALPGAARVEADDVEVREERAAEIPAWRCSAMDDPATPGPPGLTSREVTLSSWSSAGRRRTWVPPSCRRVGVVEEIPEGRRLVAVAAVGNQSRSWP